MLAQQGATWALRVALLLTLMTERLQGAYNCSRSLSPWIYVNESTMISNGKILYDGEPITSIISGYSQRYHVRLMGRYLNPTIDFSASDGARSRLFDRGIDYALPQQPPMDSITLDYAVTCAGGEESSIAIVIVDENNKSPNFIGSSSSIELSEDTCRGQEIYNFVYEVDDVDFADKPNEEKLQLVILHSTPLADAFSVIGRLGIRLNKSLKKSHSPYVLILTLQDQAQHYASWTFELTVNISAALTLNSSDANVTKCKTLDTSLLARSRPPYCSRNVEVGVFESEVQIGKEITFRGSPMQHISTLTLESCMYSKNSSFQFLELSDDGVLVFSTDFDLDEQTSFEGIYDGIRCTYSFFCNSIVTENMMRGYLNIYVMDENDEAPIFTPNAPKTLKIRQGTEFVYSFRGHVRDKDYADWPNDYRLELIITRDLWDSCGKMVSGVISVTERLALRIQPTLNASGCSPYHLTVALKDHASNIGPHHNLTIHVSAGGEVYCEKKAVNISGTRFVTLPRTRAPSIFEPRCQLTGQTLLVARCEHLEEDSSLAEYHINLASASCPDTMSHFLLEDLHQVPLSETNILQVSEELRNLTSPPSELQPADLNYASRILENVVNFYDNLTNATDMLIEILPYVAEIVSNLMEINTEIVDEARGRDSMLTARIIGSLDAMLTNLAATIAEEDQNTAAYDQPFAFHSKNLAYQITTDTTIVGIATCSWNNGTDQAFHVLYNSSAVDCLLFNGFPEAEIRFTTASPAVTRILVAYASAVLFDSGAASGAAVLSARLIGTPAQIVNESKAPVVTLRQRINQTSIDKGLSPDCGYWNFSINRWDTNGCSLGPTEDVRGMFVCTCNHLANIAVLMVPYKVGGREHDEMFDYLSMVFLAVSCVALLLVLLTFAACRETRRSEGHRLTACMSTSLLCMNVIFICGIKAANDYSEVCSTLAIVFHYFLLTTCMLITTEVIVLYLLLIKAFDAHATHYIWKVLVVCLGAPAAIVISVHFGDNSLYVRGNRYCWMQPILLYYGVILPVGLATACNIVVCTLITRSLSRIPKFVSSIGERLHVKRQAIALAAIVLVLGITCASVILSATEASTAVWEYLFVLCNALQGLFVLIFYNVKAIAICRCQKKATTGKLHCSTQKGSHNYFHDAESDTRISTTTASGDFSGSRESNGKEIEPSLPISATVGEARGLSC